MTIDKKSWGYRRDAKLSDYLSLAELVQELTITVSTGGNLLMNVGPTKDGIITPIYEERLRGMGIIILCIFHKKKKKNRKIRNKLFYHYLNFCLFVNVCSGEWLEINGEAIYKTHPYEVQNDTLSGDVWYTQSSSDGSHVYAIILSWPDNDVLRLGSFGLPAQGTVYLLGNKERKLTVYLN